MQVLHFEPEERPKDGCCIYGLYLEGARWNYHTAVLDESNPKELYTSILHNSIFNKTSKCFFFSDMPVVWLIPEENRKRPEGVYECPVYKTLTRAGTLSTTGHSTNYVLTIDVPTEKSEPHWIKRGVALICALDY